MNRAHVIVFDVSFNPLYRDLRNYATVQPVFANLLQSMLNLRDIISSTNCINFTVKTLCNADVHRTFLCIPRNYGLCLYCAVFPHFYFKYYIFNTQAMIY